MKIQLIRSKPSEVEIAVPLIYSSGPAAFEFVFKNDHVCAQDFLKYAFVRKGGEFSYDNHHSLYLDGQLIGIGSVFGKNQSAQFAMSDGLKILRFYNWRSLRILTNGLQIEQHIKLPKKNEIVIGHLGIDPSFRGKGFGTILINELIKLTNKTQDQKYVLDVSEENPRAKALYERIGFVTSVRNISKLNNKYSKVPNHFRMELQ